MLAATLLTLAAALLHASWNLIVKTSGDRWLAAWGQFLAGSVIFLPVLLVFGFPRSAAWPYLIGSAIIHVGYVGGLALAYHHGDFSFAYPLARGGGAMVASVGGAIFLGDTLTAPMWGALTIVAIGLGSLVRPSTGRIAIGWALFTAAIIGIYTVIDTAGARHSSNRFLYGVALTVCAAVAISIVGVVSGRGRAFVATIPHAWPRYAASGIALTGAYSLFLVATGIKGIQLGFVAPLRESSVVLGALAGWLFLKERMGRARLVSSGVVMLGMVLLVWARTA